MAQNCQRRVLADNAEESYWREGCGLTAEFGPPPQSPQYLLIHFLWIYLRRKKIYYASVCFPRKPDQKGQI